jgi:hypothetical protein
MLDAKPRSKGRLPHVSVRIKNELPGGPFPKTKRELARDDQRQVRSGFWQCAEFEQRFYEWIWGDQPHRFPDPRRSVRIAGGAKAVLSCYKALVSSDDSWRFFLFRYGPDDLAVLNSIVEQTLSQNHTPESIQQDHKEACALIEEASRETRHGVRVTYDTAILGMFNAIWATATEAHFDMVPPSHRKQVDPTWKRIEGSDYPDSDDTLRLMNERYRFVSHGRVEVLYERKADGWTRIKPIDAHIDLYRAFIVRGRRRTKLWNWFLKRRPPATIGVWGGEWMGD